MAADGELTKLLAEAAEAALGLPPGTAAAAEAAAAAAAEIAAEVLLPPKPPTPMELLRVQRLLLNQLRCDSGLWPAAAVVSRSARYILYSIWYCSDGVVPAGSLALAPYLPASSPASTAAAAVAAAAVAAAEACTCCWNTRNIA
jgi:hypothetical protein